MTTKAKRPSMPSEPSHIVIFKEAGVNNVSTLSSALKIGNASGVRSRASCTVLESKRGFMPKVFENIGVAVANLTVSEVRTLEANDDVEEVVLNEMRSIPPDIKLSDSESELGNDSVTLEDSLITYVRGVRDAADLFLRFGGAGPGFEGLAEAFGNRIPVSAASARLEWHLPLIGVTGSGPYSGLGIKVAVLDTGIDLDHPDFSGRVAAGESAVSFIDGQSVQDGNGHGTHCAGLAGGPLHPHSRRRYGVAPEVSLLIGKVLSDAGNGYDSQILDGIDWAAGMGAKVISMSLGSSRGNNRPYAVAYERLASTMMRRGVVLIGAAGNASDRPDLIRPVENPAACPSILAVAAIDRHRNVASFSCGETDSIGKVDICAPGVAVYSAWPGGGYKSVSGTSMATPLVAGVAALLWQRHPLASAQEIWSLLTSSGQTLGNSRDFGAGLVQAPR